MIELTITNATITAGDTPLLTNASLHVGSGECVALMGESGSGKTTLAQAILGYLAPGCRWCSGSIDVDGLNPLQLAPRSLRELRKRCAYVDQDPGAALPPGHSVRSIVRSRASLSDAQMLSLLGDFGLGDIDRILDRTPQELSGGQRRRVSVAAAVAADPELLIIDEPTTGVDAPTVELMVDTLRIARRRSQATTLVITHSMDVACALADRILTVDSRRIHPVSPQPAAACPCAAVASSADPVAARLSVTDVRVAHGAHVSCAPVSLSVGAGEIVALTAPSGAGKTSVIRCVLGLLPYSDGSIVFDGMPVASRLGERPLELRRRFGWIPQESELALNPHVEIRSLLVRTGASQEQITALLDELELPNFLCREHRRLRADDLSGGQRQRVSVALSLLGGPDLLLADEPTSALDSHSARLVLAAIRAHRAPHAAVLIASHDPAVLEIADRVVALGSGILGEGEQFGGASWD
ncbi:ABC transporter ATP-binding protein [Corynebacterium diphtheriae]|nr:ABC transporter ATP-binding protein [Corynebacterium diphtheriae]